LAASNTSSTIESIKAKMGEAEARFDRAKELYIAGEIRRSEYEEEKRLLESSKKGLRPARIDATMASVSFINSQLPNWDVLSLIEQKRLLQIVLGAAWVRDEAVVALQPTPVFMPIVAGIRSGNFGDSAPPLR